MTLGVFVIFGVHSALSGTVNAHFGCVKYSEDTGECSDKILYNNDKKYKLILIEELKCKKKTK
jgi:hypothetical protein